MKWVNLIPWIVMVFLTLTWTIGQKVKPESWGPVAFKTSILWWISILFIFINKMSPFYFVIMVPLSILIVSVTSAKAEVNYAIKNNLPGESIMTRAQPKTEALLPSLVYYSVFYQEYILESFCLCLPVFLFLLKKVQWMQLEMPLHL